MLIYLDSLLFEWHSCLQSHFSKDLQCKSWLKAMKSWQCLQTQYILDLHCYGCSHRHSVGHLRGYYDDTRYGNWDFHKSPGDANQKFPDKSSFYILRSEVQHRCKNLRITVMACDEISILPDEILRNYIFHLTLIKFHPTFIQNCILVL